MNLISGSRKQFTTQKCILSNNPVVLTKVFLRLSSNVGDWTGWGGTAVCVSSLDNKYYLETYFSFNMFS